MMAAILAAKPLATESTVPRAALPKARVTATAKPDPFLEADFVYSTGIDDTIAPFMLAAEDSPTWRKAMEGNDKQKWNDALFTELSGLDRYNVIKELLPWDAVEAECAIYDTSIVCKVKRHADGSVEKYKIRIVSRGDQWDDCELRTAAPTCLTSSFKTQCAASACRGMKYASLDVTAAFCQSDSEKCEPRYARAPKHLREYDDRGFEYIWVLGGHLYGEPPAARAWNDTWVNYTTGEVGENNDFSKGLGFYRSDHDPSLMVRKFDDGTQISVLLHVDDGFISYDCPDSVMQLYADAWNKRFDMKFKFGLPDYFLGLNLSSSSDHDITISNETYIRTIKEEFLPKPIEEYPAAHTPALPHVLMEQYETARRTAGQPVDPKLQKAYRSIVGKLQYAACTGRPDVLFAVGICGRALTFPSRELLDSATRIAVYLVRSATLGLHYSGHAPNATELVAWSDSDWSAQHSTSGGDQQLAGATVGSVSRKQICVTLSSTEAELIAMSVVSCDITYYRGLCDDLGLPQRASTSLKCDNKGAKDLAHDYTTSSRSRHIERRWFKVRELVHKAVVKVISVPTADNIADFFTKVLDRRTFERFRAQVMGLPAKRSVSFIGLLFGFRGSGSRG